MGLLAVVRRAGGAVSAGALGSDGSRSSLSAADVEKLLAIPPGHAPVSTTIGGDGYRAVASVTRDGDIVVTALPTADVDDTMWTVLAIMTAVALAALRQIADMQDDPADMRLVARRAIAAVTRG